MKLKKYIPKRLQFKINGCLKLGYAVNGFFFLLVIISVLHIPLG